MCKIVMAHGWLSKPSTTCSPGCALFADSAYAGDKLVNKLAEFGHWTIELIKRPAATIGVRHLGKRVVYCHPPNARICD